MDLASKNAYLAVYDGDCGLCAASVQFIFRHDKDKQYFFTPIQSPLGSAICCELGISPENPSGFVAIVGGKHYTKSRAVLRVAVSFGGAWKVLFILWVIPRILLDWIYDLIACRRKTIFQSARQCMVDPSFKSRMILKRVPIIGAGSGS